MDLAPTDLGAIHRPIGDGKKAGEVMAVARKERLADARGHHAVGQFANRSDPELLFDTLSGRTTTNSSPPRRAPKSEARIVPRSREAVTCRTRSPASWPNRSFTSLKPSRSR